MTYTSYYTTVGLQLAVNFVCCAGCCWWGVESERTKDKQWSEFLRHRAPATLYHEESVWHR